MPVTAGWLGASVEIGVRGMAVVVEMEGLGKGCILRPYGPEASLRAEITWS